MNKGNRNKTWLIITAIIIGIACVPVSGTQSVGFTNSGISDWTSLVRDVTPLTNGIAGIVQGVYIGNGGFGRILCPDLKADSLSYPSTVNSGGKFTITMTVTNSGTLSSLKTDLLVRLPGDVVIPMPTTVPPLKPGETKEITFTITIPPGISIGNAPFTVTLYPGRNSECSLSNNEVSGTTFVLPEGMTQEEYERQTSPPLYKITGQPFVNPLQGGGGPLPP